ncbi:DNA mismatch repair protein MutL, partial [bacterium]
MGKINVLDELTANQIAAGEVVERPASVVKELVENAIDARSTMIEVDIQEGGIQSISITDNGSGLEKEDAALAFQRHATSKIRAAEDLDMINTLGFRGEALPS